MPNEIFDLIIIGAGPSGLFTALQIEKDLKLLILEKSEVPAQKLLLSAKWRGNVTNRTADESHYFPEGKVFVKKAFEHYGVSDFLSFLENHHLAFHEEDFWRILLDHGAKEFQQCLLTKLQEKKIPIHFGESPETIQKNHYFEISTHCWTYFSKNLLIATGSKSVPSLWSSDLATQVAQQFHLCYEPFYPALVGFETEKDLSSLSWSSLIAKGELWIDHKKVSEQTGPILFTHRWLSGPVIFNASLRLTEEQRKKNLIELKVIIKKQDITKRFLWYLGFKQNKLNTYLFTTKILKTRDFTEAKVCGWGIHCEELDENFQSTKIPWLFFIGEAVNITGETGGFNLQRCWTSAKCCSNYFSV